MTATARSLTALRVFAFVLAAGAWGCSCSDEDRPPSIPLDATVPDGAISPDAQRQDAGMRDGSADAGADAGPELGLCEECTDHAQCGASARCFTLTSGVRACVAICEADLPMCPRGFRCVHDFTVPDTSVCVPLGEQCCIDEDADAYGRGVGCLGTDCNDGDITINPGEDEICNGHDDNCDGVSDTDAVDCAIVDCRAAMTRYEEVAPSSCVDAACTPPPTTPCGLFTCEGGGDVGAHCATTCTVSGADDEGLCVASAHCDVGACSDDFANGDTCDEDTDCVSAHCDNAFCCDMGTCCRTPTDCPGVGGIGATCDSPSTCQGTRGELTCTDYRCGTRAGVADDSACTATIEADTCGFFRSIFCTAAVDQPLPRCPTTCASDSECDSGAHCDVVCLPDLSDGDVCNEDSDCSSAHCARNICCRSGDCCRDPSDCPASYSTAPVCTTPSACQGERDAALCGDFMCSTATHVPDDSACTSTVAASTCGLYPTVYCTGGSDQPTPMCLMMCTSDSECDDTAHCDLASCTVDLPDGAGCDEGTDCVSGHCQNGFCCATGDCCAVGGDCPSTTYGQASVCDSAATCQGQRRDPECNAAHQCQVGGLVDDDSGCGGLLANACGLYPSVFCTGAMAQPSDQMSLCAMTCTASTDCDPGAHCESGACVADGDPGDPCTTTGQCASGLGCVDGVCCTSSCTGTCMACNVAGSLGTCTFVPNGADPIGECLAVSCANYYWGWAGALGDQCYRRSDAPSASVFCDGAGACQDAADVCPSRPQGALYLNCDDVCQTETIGTCTGMTAGTCTNSPAGSQTCGTGACQRTTARCNMGTQVMCMPGSPTAEVCDDIDNNCNGATDEGLSGDGYEPNNSCSAATYLGTLYSVAMPGEPSSLTVRPTLYGSGDVDVFRIDFRENDSSCGCGASTDEDYAIVTTVTVPVGAGSYRVCSFQSGTCSTSGTCTTISAGSSGTVTVWKDGCCSPFGCGDSGTWWITVSGVGSPGYECRSYTLAATAQQGCM